MKLFIATPCAHDLVVSHYTAAIFQLAQALTRGGVDAEIALLGYSDLEASRSVLASRFLADTRFTHMLFVDSDTGFDPNLIKRMIELGEDFVGAMYAKRQLDWEKLVRHARDNPDEPAQTAVSRSVDYVGAVTGQASAENADKLVVQVKSGFATASYVGMGVCLLRRRVFEEMVRRGVVTTDGNPSNISPWPVPFYPFFFKERLSPTVANSEDVSFCHRWTRDCGGTIWACIDEAIGHYGSSRFAGTYIDVLRAAAS